MKMENKYWKDQEKQYAVTSTSADSSSGFVSYYTVDGTTSSTINTFRADNASYVQVSNPSFATTDAL